MNYRQPTLQEAVQAGQEAQAAVEAAANKAWLDACERCIRELDPGSVFLPEDIVAVVVSQGYTTSNKKAIGPVVNRLSRQRVIRQTGRMQKAKTSHGQMRPEWVKG